MATKDVFDGSTDENVTLENMGYEQEFKRSFSLLDMVGFSFSIVTCWTALSGVFIIGIQAGGPPIMIFGWIGVCLFTVLIALAMAEMCSRWPVAGGQYSWVAVLAPPLVSRQLSYITGWFMLTGLLAMGAVSNSLGSNYILGQVNLVFPDFVIERWHTVLIAWALGIFSLTINVFAPHALHRLSRFILVWNIISFIIIITALLATNHQKQDTDFVFHEFRNMTGFGASMASIVGILQSFFGMCCYDAPSHMTEEMTHASRDAPKAIIMSVIMGAVTGLLFLLTLCFCMGDIEATANSSTGVPVIQIFYDSTQSKAGTCILASMITLIIIMSSISLTAEGSRSVYAFARDRGLPFSGLWSQVEPKKKIPLYAILLTVGVQLGLNAIYFGTETGFATVISIATTGFYVSYSLVLFSRLLGYFFRSQSPSFDGPYSLPLPVSLGFSAIGLLFLLFASVTFNFPSDAPVTSESMNYTSAAIGMLTLLSLVTWFTTATNRFAGPSDIRRLVVEGVESLPALQAMDDGGSGTSKRE
ncbi:Amino acid/polyamine transporter I [Penicillium cf. griseofulvum]|uniref:Amino acid/polyamine transporter I n=1 Tax=Penicillium cf. griseofulvum TaxID=2972120 RepID=A0A9W9T656_9EURO|nr:Amino acid/polyamine transporter I [Penicillium cf. griseofulvum]KAJ5428502.1 Amino acid/polyamine transporter I [Penicillium cf. griseofulvum]